MSTDGTDPEWVSPEPGTPEVALGAQVVSPALPGVRRAGRRAWHSWPHKVIRTPKTMGGGRGTGQGTPCWAGRCQDLMPSGDWGGCSWGGAARAPEVSSVSYSFKDFYCNERYVPYNLPFSPFLSFRISSVKLTVLSRRPTSQLCNSCAVPRGCSVPTKHPLPLRDPNSRAGLGLCLGGGHRGQSPGPPEGTSQPEFISSPITNTLKTDRSACHSGGASQPRREAHLGLLGSKKRSDNTA